MDGLVKKYTGLEHMGFFADTQVAPGAGATADTLIHCSYAETLINKQELPSHWTFVLVK
jgi:hypothetical protein